MALAFNYFFSNAANMPNGVVNFASDTLKLMLSNTAPVATNAVKADITEIANGNGYTTGGATITVTGSTQTAGLYSLTATSITPWTASGGGIGPFRYVILYDSTPAGGKLIGWWDRGSSVTIVATSSYAPTFGAALLTLQGV